MFLYKRVLGEERDALELAVDGDGGIDDVLDGWVEKSLVHISIVVVCRVLKVKRLLAECGHWVVIACWRSSGSSVGVGLDFVRLIDNFHSPEMLSCFPDNTSGFL